MTTAKIIITGRIEEVPSFGQFTIESLNNFIADFLAYKPNKYLPAFMTELETGLQAVNQIVNPVTLTAELKVITFRLMQNVVGLRVTMNLLEGYLDDATGLTISKADFGIKDVRKKISSGDVEGLNSKLGTVLTNITSNMAALENVGYTAAMKNALEDTRTKIFKDNGEQNKKMEERSELVKKNIGIINDFLIKIKGIWADGKRLYSINNKERAKLFSNTGILKKIRNDELHTIITGVVYDIAGKPAAGAKIMARPSTEGKRGKTVKSGPDGVYELKGLKPVNYNIQVTLKSGGIFVANVDAVTNKTVTLNLKEGM
ncbi:MAG: carboxypeptidase-like regulatory domain-containing protein [Bacteroidota bacterium]